MRVFGLAYKDEPANVTRFLAEAGDPFANIGADRKGRTAIDWGIYGVPETFVVKGDGTIAYRFVGPIGEESYRNVILPEIEKALKEGGNKDFTVKELPKLNHLFQTAKTGGIAEYATIEETFAPSALALIAEWIEKRK